MMDPLAVITSSMIVGACIGAGSGKISYGVAAGIGYAGLLETLASIAVK